MNQTRGGTAAQQLAANEMYPHTAFADYRESEVSDES
jgi:hypothetical protein